MKQLKQKCFLLTLLFALAFTAAGQVNFEAKVNRSEVGKNERFTIQFVLNAEGSNFQAPSFENFRMLGGPNRSTSMRIINFQRSIETSFSYVLMPEQTGSHTIGPASIKVDGETYYTDPVTIKVTEESPRASDPNDPYSKAAKNAFFKVITSKTKVYQGEPFVTSYKLYFANEVNVSRPTVLDEPNFTGFYKDNLEINRIPTSTETYRGQRYQTGVFNQKVLIPQQSGKISPGKVEVQIPTQLPTNRRDVFGRRMSQTVNQTVSEGFPVIEVLPLPQNGRPSGFSGAVGDYDLTVSLSRSQLPANESVTLSVKISGRGNIKLIEAPQPEIPSAFEAYDPEYSENIRVNASGMSGTKTYEYLLVPRYGGTYKIPEMKFSYFDPQLERYHSLSSEELELTITGGTARPGDNKGMARSEKEEVDFIGEDILFIKTSSDDFQKTGQTFLGSTAFYSLLGGMGVIWAGMIGFFFFAGRRGSNQQRLRSQRAGKKAQKHLSEAKKALSGQDEEKFYQALSAALWGYFADKFNIPQSRLSKENIHDTLLQQGVEPELVREVMETMDRAEMARFTSAHVSTPEEDYNETARLLTQIEKSL